MKQLLCLFTVMLLALGCSSAPTQNWKPLKLTAADLQKLRWIEGSWRGTGGGVPPFFERYRFENETTLAVDGLEGDKVTETTLFVLKDGEFGGGGEGSRYVASALDDNSITFQPVIKAKNAFRWQRETRDSWKAVLSWPATKDKPAGERTYNMERWPKP